jgi:hypothetical protein
MLKVRMQKWKNARPHRRSPRRKETGVSAVHGVL